MALSFAPVARADGVALVPPGVTVGTVDVGGLTRDAAIAEVQRVFLTTPLQIGLPSSTRTVAPAKLGVGLWGVGAAVDAALVHDGPGDVPLLVIYDYDRADTLLRHVAGEVLLARRSAAWRFRGAVPSVIAERAGHKLAGAAFVRAVVRAIRVPGERVFAAPLSAVAARVARSDLGPAVVIQRASNRLAVYRFIHGRVARWKQFGVATGQAAYPTPLGTFSIVEKLRNPWWYPPASPWAQGKDPVPPGPGNPLGTRWMGLSAPLVGIHGTPDDASIGYSRSLGCIRMHIADAEWVFDHVRIGTPVRIDGS